MDGKMYGEKVEGANGRMAGCRHADVQRLKRSVRRTQDRERHGRTDEQTNGRMDRLMD
jgi:hypothetical protein